MSSSPRHPTISGLNTDPTTTRRPERISKSGFRDIGLLLKRVLKDDGSFFLNIAGTSSDPWIAADAANAMRDIFRLQNSIIWVKSISIGEESFGHFKPVNSRRYLNHLARARSSTSPRTARRRSTGWRSACPSRTSRTSRAGGTVEDRRCGGDVWFIPYQTIRSKSQRDHHPSPFPVELAERCIKLHGTPRRMTCEKAKWVRFGARPLPRRRLHSSRRPATRISGNRHRDRRLLRRGGRVASEGAADLRNTELKMRGA